MRVVLARLWTALRRLCPIALVGALAGCVLADGGSPAAAQTPAPPGAPPAVSLEVGRDGQVVIVAPRPADPQPLRAQIRVVPEAALTFFASRRSGRSSRGRGRSVP